MMIQKPEASEHSAEMTPYISLVPDDGFVLEHLETSFENTIALARSIPESQLSTPFAPGEWSVKEILTHLVDDERIFAYRALRFGRNDTTDLPGFDQDAYVPASNANMRHLDAILAEMSAVRQSTIMLFSSFNEEVLRRQGIASGSPLSVRAVIYHIAGHELHHYQSIRENYAN